MVCINVRAIAKTIGVLSILCSTSGKIASASAFRILQDDSIAMQARIDMIQRAEQTIDLAYFGLNTDEAPVAILELLRQASQRGVKVRIVVDGYRAKIPTGLVRYLKRSGVPIRIYHHRKHLDPTWHNQRIHSKLMVADSTIAIVGSRNLENENFGLGESRNYVDCDAIVAGEVAVQVQSYFDWLWRLPDVKSPAGSIPIRVDLLRFRKRGHSEWHDAWRRADCVHDYQRLLSRSIDRVTCRMGVELYSNCDPLGDAVRGIDIQLLHDCRTDKSNRRFQRHVLRMMDCAEHCVLIESPFPAFHAKTRAAIARARKRGVRVTILTNSLESTTIPSAYAAYQNQKRSFLRQGVQLWEFCGRNTLHAKTMIVDHSTWMLGSYNFDIRSDISNLELAIVSDCPVGAAMLATDIQTRISKSTRIQPGKLILPIGGNPSLSQRSKLLLRRCLVESYRGLL
jgi:putative cardiolipin synthase